MHTRCLEINPTNPDPAVLGEAVVLLQQGEIVAFPTETVYGLGANALDRDAVARIYTAKGRPATNPLIVHVASARKATALVRVWPDAIARLVAKAWPGPLTVVLPRSDSIPDIVTAGMDQVGIRVPAHPVARALLDAVDLPLAAPSANRSEHVSPTRAWHVVASLGGRIPMVLDGGTCEVGLESTVVRWREDESLTILRPGMLDAAILEKWSGIPVRIPHPEIRQGQAVPSPGQDLKHYAPDTPTSIVKDLGPLRNRTTDTIGVMACTASPPWFQGPWLTLGDDPVDYARQLYGSLYELDRLALERILILAPPRMAAWHAIWDRIRRADDGLFTGQQET